MEIEQKKFSTVHTFTFNDEVVNFAFKDKSGSADIDVEYGTFPKKSSVSIEQNEWVRNVGVLWIIIGCLGVVRAYYSDLPLLSNSFWLVLGIVCMIWFFASKVTFSVFKSEQGNVFIIQDKKHDTIIEEIFKRKKAQLLRWYGDINLDNELENEINKFRWLADQQVITTTEAEEKIAQLEFAHQDPELKQHQLN
ncbi:hypothetical protein [Shewanella sp. TC10]|uniref:hypothetical protein n=1 Tax=Shewanella sp. TC10 TaxID=1419739 RepID=UPI00129E0AB5|nr:hypothetical protein [Shewanella sp. TC10]